MSTRANIILKEGKDKLFFYRHSDGYPSGTMPSLQRFVDWMKAGKIRNNINQGSGWLIILGAIEYNTIPKYKTEPSLFGAIEKEDTIYESIEEPKDWKVGAYQPTTGLHSDIQYLYTIDMNKMEITAQSADCSYETGNFTFRTLSEIEMS